MGLGDGLQIESSSTYIQQFEESEMSTVMESKYHERREAQERDHAEQAKDKAARNIHNEMANRHASEKTRKAKLGLFKD